MDQETLDLIAKYREYNPDYSKYTDEEITQLGLKGFENNGEEVVEEEKVNFMDYLPFGDKSLTGMALQGIGNFLPSRDPRQTALDDFYGSVSDGTIQSGLMAGYNPVSGGFLNTITGGRFGEPTNYGLQGAYQKRIDMRTNPKTLARIAKLSQERQDAFAQKTKDLQSAKIQESMMLDQVNRDRAYRDEVGDSYSGGETTAGDDTSYSDPFDPGGGEKDGGFIDGSNRRKFFYGGIASIL